jgi:hypothetical protein
MSSKENNWKKYYPYFLDLWQYLVIIIVIIIGAIFIL